MTLEQMIANASGVTERAFAKYGEVKPHWYVLTRNDERKLIPRPPGPFTKQQVAVLIRRLLQDMDAIQVVFVDEVWQVLAETDEQMAAINAWYETHPSLEDYPGRVEAVMFQAEAEDGRLLTAWREIHRPPGKATLGPLSQYKPLASEGRFAGWLAGRGTRQ